MFGISLWSCEETVFVRMARDVHLYSLDSLKYSLSLCVSVFMHLANLLHRDRFGCIEASRRREREGKWPPRKLQEAVQRVRVHFGLVPLSGCVCVPFRFLCACPVGCQRCQTPTTQRSSENNHGDSLSPLDYASYSAPLLERSLFFSSMWNSVEFVLHFSSHVLQTNGAQV